MSATRAALLVGLPRLFAIRGNQLLITISLLSHIFNVLSFTLKFITTCCASLGPITCDTRTKKCLQKMTRGRKQGAGRMATRSTPAAETSTTAVSASAEIDNAVHQIAAASRSSIAGSIAPSAATTAAASWVSTHAKLDVFGSGQIWVPAIRARSLPDKEAKYFLFQIWTQLAAFTTNGTLSNTDASDSIIGAFTDSNFIVARVWDGVGLALQGRR